MPGPQGLRPQLCGHMLLSPTHRWWLLLWGVLQACPTQGSVLLAQQLPQQLTSPGYPEPYVKGQEISSDIEAPEGFAVRLVFQDFDLEPSQDCRQDSVTVSCGGGPGGTLGRKAPGLEPRGRGVWLCPQWQKMADESKSGAQAAYLGGQDLPQGTAFNQRPCPCPRYRVGPTEQKSKKDFPAFGSRTEGHTSTAKPWSKRAGTHVSVVKDPSSIGGAQALSDQEAGRK